MAAHDLAEQGCPPGLSGPRLEEPPTNPGAVGPRHRRPMLGVGQHRPGSLDHVIAQPEGPSAEVRSLPEPTPTKDLNRRTAYIRPRIPGRSVASFCVIGYRTLKDLIVVVTHPPFKGPDGRSRCPCGLPRACCTRQNESICGFNSPRQAGGDGRRHAALFRVAGQEGARPYSSGAIDFTPAGQGPDPRAHNQAVRIPRV